MRPSLLVFVCILFLTSAVPALAEDPHPAVAPTLTGETLHAVSGTVSVNCNPDGSGAASYRVSGVATGPYPGAFRESGGLTFTSGPSSATPILSGFRATFAILSEVGTVTGTKSLLRRPRPLLGVCSGSTVGVTSVPLRYTATIETRTGLFRDSGLSTATIVATDPNVITLEESFVSTLETANVVLDPPGNSFPVQPGQGCGDQNHFHEDAGLCAVPDAIDVPDEPAP